MEITPKMIAKKLNAAADLLETKGWTRGYYAKTKTGTTCDVNSRKAVCFCVSGALQRGDIEVAVAAERALVAFLKLPLHTLIDWNDSRRSAKTVINALRGAAKQVLAEANGGTV